MVSLSDPWAVGVGASTASRWPVGVISSTLLPSLEKNGLRTQPAGKGGLSAVSKKLAIGWDGPQSAPTVGAKYLCWRVPLSRVAQTSGYLIVECARQTHHRPSPPRVEFEQRMDRLVIQVHEVLRAG